jgi:hypothetical protein
MLTTPESVYNPENENPALCGVSRSGRYVARTRDLLGIKQKADAQRDVTTRLDSAWLSRIRGCALAEPNRIAGGVIHNDYDLAFLRGEQRSASAPAPSF